MSIDHAPATTARLLRLLGVQHHSARGHHAAIADWLQHNDATAPLKISLRAKGYGRLLPPPHMPVPRKVGARVATHPGGYWFGTKPPGAQPGSFDPSAKGRAPFDEHT